MQQDLLDLLLHNLLRVFELFKKTYFSCPPPNFMEVTCVWGVEVSPISNGAVGERVALKG